MLYNRLSDDELERAVYIDPTNAAARAEQLTRVPRLMDEDSEALEEAKMELEGERQEHKAEVANLEEELAASEHDRNETMAELDTAHERIAELTKSADLV